MQRRKTTQRPQVYYLRPGTTPYSQLLSRDRPAKKKKKKKGWSIPEVSAELLIKKMNTVAAETDAMIQLFYLKIENAKLKEKRRREKVK